MEFEVWHIWLMVSLICFILEIFLPSFVVFNFGIGALFATVTSAIGLNVNWQITIFSLSTAASFFLVRPGIKKWAYSRSDKVETNANAMIGRIGIVTETIDITKNSGRVSLDGDEWKAISIDGKEIEKQLPVTIKHVDSVVLVVEKLN